MKISRRELFKQTILGTTSIALVSKTAGIFNNAFAAAKDAKIKRQGYLRDVSKASPEALAKIKRFTKYKTDTFTPMCSNCKFYKKPKDGYGKCTMVGATGKPGKLVFEKGICKVYAKKK